MSDYGKYVEIRTGTLTIGGTSIGNVKLVDFFPVYERHPIIDGTLNKAVDVKEFVKELHLKVLLDKFTYANFEKIRGITASDISAGTQAVTDESVTLTGTGWHDLAHGREQESPISAVTVTGAGGSPTYTENTDYVMDYTYGRIRRLAGGSIGDGTEVLVDYSYTTQTAKEIRFSDDVNTQAEVIYQHTTQDSDKTFEIELHNAYIVNDVTVQHSPDGLTEFEVEFVSLYDSTQSGQELGHSRWNTS